MELRVRSHCEPGLDVIMFYGTVENMKYRDNSWEGSGGKPRRTTEV